MTERCPSCGATVRGGDPWCTLCWADLRPQPEPVPPAAPAAPVTVAPPPAAPQYPTVDPLTAPLATLVGDAPAPTPTWPCVECGAANSFDLPACGTCTAPFGGRTARLPDAKETRRKVLLVALGAVGLLLLLLATYTFAATSTPKVDKAPTEINLQP